MQTEPYTVAHDQMDAGLRDYRAKPEGWQDPISLQWLLLATLIVLALIIGFVTGRTL